ncbi:TRAF3-interacting protein 1 isoform X3 [Corvus moneduloides]|uniref:TRAF3-interacting protein 1 isoform X3 n=1 Tax=Corvus moneduloides TaxID=1196302 RepID=UPI001363800E|nr:TRAF3-interacting protein 1 isoform X3 [Corvus moneduloides]
MNEAVSRRTRETLGQVIRKPPLTDALLNKPPFRYLHDLISEVIRVTGFLKGLYTDFELKSDNVKDKDSKINFLQKAIDAVVMVTGEPLSVKPARVVAGHEPEKTNEFLQAIGKCCLNKLSSDAAVKRVLAGEKADAKGKPPPSKPRDKESREPKAEEQKSHRDKEPTDSEESTLRKPQRPTKDSKCQPDTENESPARISRQPSAKGSRHRSKPGGEGAVDARSVADGISEDGAAEVQEKNEPGLAERQKEGETENVAPEKPENGEVPPDPPPQPAQRRIPRPSSARPAPPRVKRQESTELLIPERSGSAKTAPHVIREQQVSDEEDEQFVVEAAGPLPEMPKEPEVELLEDQKHGGLVKRILETKKDYEASQKSSQTPDREKPLVSEASRKRERDLVAKEIERFQVSIQTVCQNAFRLGRIVDYVQEDMDAMRNELHAWRQENREHAEALQREQSITDSAVEPLKADLAELEQLIKDQQDKICAVKANILRNEEKIQRMVLSINLSSRR